jgi:glycosyltransferase involved in cell wall biosynthesis
MGIKNLFQPRMKYKLIHFVVGDDHYQPLVKSQSFEQAYIQMINSGYNAPDNVLVMYYCHYRDLLNGRNSKFKKDITRNYPGLRIIPIIRTIRFSSILKFIQLNLQIPLWRNCIIHCRGESAFSEINQYKISKKVKLVLDLRGLWSHEFFLHRGIGDINSLDQKDFLLFKEIERNILNCITKADGVSFVSSQLRDYFRDRGCSPQSEIVVPCLTRDLNNKIKTKKDSDFYRIVYLGTDRPYQHLQDMGLPFMKILLESSDNIVFKIISKDLESIRKKIELLGMKFDKIELKEVDRSQVITEMQDCDLALLLRRSSIINLVASPVKIGEYLSIGLPMIWQKGSLSISESAVEQDLGIEIDIEENVNWFSEVKKVQNYLNQKDKTKHRKEILKFFKTEYTWESNLPKQRKFYFDLLNR